MIVVLNPVAYMLLWFDVHLKVPIRNVMSWRQINITRIGTRETFATRPNCLKTVLI